MLQSDAASSECVVGAAVQAEMRIFAGDAPLYNSCGRIPTHVTILRGGAEFER